jgi:hypothetical protein
MKMAKKSSKFLKALGRYFEISKAVLNAVLDQGGTDDDFARILSDAELRREIARLIVAKPVKSEFPSSAIAAEYGYAVVEDVAPTLKSVGDLEFAPFLEPGEDYVNGETMRQRAKKLGANLGLVDLKFVLDRQAEIPAEMRDKYIVFSGTVLRNPNGYLYVADLYRSGDGWYLRWNYLDRDWLGSGRLARSK